MQYTNTTNEPTPIGCEAKQSAALRETMELATNMGESALILSKKINGFLFKSNPANEERLVSPECFEEALLLHVETLHDLCDELHVMMDRLGL